MRNQKTINEQRFERIIWRQQNGVFTGHTYINRKTLGEFCVEFKMNAKNGATCVSIRNIDYPALLWGATCATYAQAVEKVKQRFDLIDGLVKDLREIGKQADEQRRQTINRAVHIALMGIENWESENE